VRVITGYGSDTLNRKLEKTVTADKALGSSVAGWTE
jgi:hypothetical protein